MTRIDFRATLFSPGVTIGSLSANRKRRFEVHDGAKLLKSANACAMEISKATAELETLIGSPSFEREQEANLHGLANGVEQRAKRRH